MFRNVRSRHATRTAGIAAALGAMLATEASAAPAVGRHLAPVAEQRSAVRHAAQVATYTLRDVGAPNNLPNFSGFSSPAGFNNTGQFVGTFYNKQDIAEQCVAFTGKTWVLLNNYPTTGNCYPTSGISDANAAGVFTTVGSLNIPTIAASFLGTAFYSTVSPTSATTTLFPKNNFSGLWLDNKSGLAAGETTYNPVGGFPYDSGVASVTATATGTSLSLLQPQCTTSVTTCMYPFSNEPGFQAGGRYMNASGTILGQAIPNISGAGAYIEYTGGKSPTALQFNLPPAGIRVGGPYGIDDNGDVVYSYENTHNETLGWIYNPKTKVATSLGIIPGYSCVWQPVWINGPGRVLGYSYGCANDVPNFFWTWDSKHGMVQVGDFPGYYVDPVIINDKGEIAVDLGLPNYGPHHWGYLEPPSGF